MSSGKTATVGASTAELDLLVDRCRQGDREALGAFYRRYRGEVARNLHRVLGPGRRDLEDVLQEVFIEAFRSIARFRGDARVSTWLYRVCVNVALQRLRKHRRLAEVSPDQAREPTGGESPERALDTRRKLEAVYRILDQLAPKKRVVFVLHEIEGMAPKEIAELVGAPVLTVRTRLHYARKEFYARAAADPRFDGGKP